MASLPVPVAPGPGWRAARFLLMAQLALSPVLFFTGLLDPFESCKAALLQLSALALLVVGLRLIEPGEA